MMTDDSTETKERRRELAYRYDLFIAPDWCVRFDSIVATHVAMPKRGRLLEINCGTGARAIAVAATLEEGDVVGADESAERVAIARAKAAAADAERCTFVEAIPEDLAFEDGAFDGVVLDATITGPERLPAIVAEAVRVAKANAPVSVKILLRGSFDEFFSIYWEALHDVGIADEVWPRLEPIITSHQTLGDAIEIVRGAGLHKVESHRSKEEWRFDSGADFLASPLVTDLFLADWLDIVPPGRLDEVRAEIERVIDRESEGSYFDVSAKALVLSGHK
jgi:ubiquinone/menaquinone biosynthesis C-methylase UbiE